MNTRIKTNKKTLIRWKIYIDRARMYLGYIQFVMVGFVFLGTFKDQPFGAWIFDNLFISAPILFVLFMIASIIIGRIDTTLGLREEELRNSSASNPVMMDIFNDVQAIKQELLKQKVNESLD